MRKYFDIRDMIKEVPEATYYHCVGQGGVGKSYSVKTLLLEHYLKEERPFLYIKRYDSNAAGSALDSVFEDTVKDPMIAELMQDKYNRDNKYAGLTVVQSGHWFKIKGYDDDGKLSELAKCGRIHALSKAQDFKGGVYQTTDYVFLDEYISDVGYVKGDKEPDQLQKIVGTIARTGHPVKVFLCGNPDAPIEMCPYLYNMRLDYEHLQSNAIYKFDTKTSEGKILANNHAFIKLSGYAGETGYIDERAGNAFGTATERVRMSGEVATNEYIHVEDPEVIRIGYVLEVESPVITETEYHKRFYVNIGWYHSEPCIYITDHNRYNNRSRLYCRYDREVYRPRDIRQTYRLNIPPEDTFSDLRRLFQHAMCTQLIIVERNQTGTLFEQILKAS